MMGSVYPIDPARLQHSGWSVKAVTGSRKQAVMARRRTDKSISGADLRLQTTTRRLDSLLDSTTPSFCLDHHVHICLLAILLACSVVLIGLVVLLPSTAFAES